MVGKGRDARGWERNVGCLGARRLRAHQNEKGKSMPTDGHLSHSALDPAAQETALAEIVAADADLRALLALLHESGLPDAWLTSGAVYGTVWNALSGKPHRHGVKDYDVIYFDPSDRSWEAEDAAIRRLTRLTAPLGLAVELRNQARVHLWFERRFGSPYPPLTHATESLRYYAAETHAVAVQSDGARIKVAAPFGLTHIFAFRMVPNGILDNATTYREKAARAKRNWPELVVEPWPDL